MAGGTLQKPPFLSSRSLVLSQQRPPTISASHFAVYPNLDGAGKGKVRQSPLVLLLQLCCSYEIAGCLRMASGKAVTLRQQQ